VVKLVNAESTWLETAWEDRKLLIKKRKRDTEWCLFFFSNVIYYFGLAVSSQINRVMTKVYLIRPGISRAHDLKEQSDA
ncbi:hypothetical protein, partial [Veillonella sp. CHU594]|uniref:hypothetical protein n=1 Tax=Veillonella sp. CHU594 TaxID=2490948 RepID=UPI00197F8960